MKRKLLLLILVLLLAARTAAADREPLPNDSITTALFFGDIKEPLSAERTPELWAVGDEKEFSVLDVGTGAYSKCTAKVFLVTENMVFWLDPDDLENIPESITARLSTFESETLPLLRGVFGEENPAGMAADPRIHVLFSSKIGLGYNGYFSAEDSADPALNPVSNGMNLLLLNTLLIPQGGDAVVDTLAHEYQHLIHFSHDPNETDFINEGFSGLAEYLAVDKIKDIFIRNYLNDTGRSLVWWPESGNKGPYYGSSFLFSVYLYDRFGPALIRAAVRNPGNGLHGLDAALTECGYSVSAEEVFLRWGAAVLGNLLSAPVRDSDYSSYAFPQNGITRDIQPLPCGTDQMHESSQFGLRFYQTDCAQPSVIEFTGTAESAVTGLPIPGGAYAWWSGAVSNSLAYLRRTIALPSAPDQDIRFEYDAVYSIEEGYDYYYLLLEDENGETFRLSPASTSDENPSGVNKGNGTTGSSGGIRHESIDLNSWAGQQVRLTFVYLTDTAGVGDGLLLDNFRISSAGFFDDAEESDNGWETAGFSRIPASLPQQYALTVLRREPDGSSAAEFHIITGGETAVIDCPEGSCAFSVSAIAPDIRSRAAFTISSRIMSNP